MPDNFSGHEDLIAELSTPAVEIRSRCLADAQRYIHEMRSESGNREIPKASPVAMAAELAFLTDDADLLGECMGYVAENPSAMAADIAEVSFIGIQMGDTSGEAALRTVLAAERDDVLVDRGKGSGLPHQPLPPTFPRNRNP